MTRGARHRHLVEEQEEEVEEVRPGDQRQSNSSHQHRQNHQSSHHAHMRRESEYDNDYNNDDINYHPHNNAKYDICEDDLNNLDHHQETAYHNLSHSQYDRNKQQSHHNQSHRRNSLDRYKYDPNSKRSHPQHHQHQHQHQFLDSVEPIHPSDNNNHDNNESHIRIHAFIDGVRSPSPNNIQEQSHNHQPRNSHINSNNQHQNSQAHTNTGTRPTPHAPTSPTELATFRKVLSFIQTLAPASPSGPFAGHLTAESPMSRLAKQNMALTNDDDDEGDRDFYNVFVNDNDNNDGSDSFPLLSSPRRAEDIFEQQQRERGGNGNGNVGKKTSFELEMARAWERARAVRNRNLALDVGYGGSDDGGRETGVRTGGRELKNVDSGIRASKVVVKSEPKELEAGFEDVEGNQSRGFGGSFVGRPQFEVEKERTRKDEKVKQRRVSTGNVADELQLKRTRERDDSRNPVVEPKGHDGRGEDRRRRSAGDAIVESRERDRKRPRRETHDEESFIPFRLEETERRGLANDDEGYGHSFFGDYDRDDDDNPRAIHEEPKVRRIKMIESEKKGGKTEGVISSDALYKKMSSSKDFLDRFRDVGVEEGKLEKSTKKGSSKEKEREKENEMELVKEVQKDKEKEKEKRVERMKRKDGSTAKTPDSSRGPAGKGKQRTRKKEIGGKLPDVMKVQLPFSKDESTSKPAPVGIFNKGKKSGRAQNRIGAFDEESFLDAEYKPSSASKSKPAKQSEKTSRKTRADKKDKDAVGKKKESGPKIPDFFKRKEGDNRNLNDRDSDVEPLDDEDVKSEAEAEEDDRSKRDELAGFGFKFFDDGRGELKMKKGVNDDSEGNDSTKGGRGEKGTGQGAGKLLESKGLRKEGGKDDKETSNRGFEVYKDDDVKDAKVGRDETAAKGIKDRKQTRIFEESMKASTKKQPSTKPKIVETEDEARQAGNSDPLPPLNATRPWRRKRRLVKDSDDEEEEEVPEPASKVRATERNVTIGHHGDNSSFRESQRGSGHARGLGDTQHTAVANEKENDVDIVMGLGALKKFAKKLHVGGSTSSKVPSRHALEELDPNSDGHSQERRRPTNEVVVSRAMVSMDSMSIDIRGSQSRKVMAHAKVGISRHEKGSGRNSKKEVRLVDTNPGLPEIDEILANMERETSQPSLPPEKSKLKRVQQADRNSTQQDSWHSAGSVSQSRSEFVAPKVPARFISRSGNEGDRASRNGGRRGNSHSQFRGVGDGDRGDGDGREHFEEDVRRDSQHDNIEDYLNLDADLYMRDGMPVGQERQRYGDETFDERESMVGGGGGGGGRIRTQQQPQLQHHFANDPGYYHRSDVVFDEPGFPSVQSLFDNGPSGIGDDYFNLSDGQLVGSSDSKYIFYNKD
ncbi:hypothetical protein HDU76_007525 [Blyttiomyces sp. JEL0837]|nr:hypothetical protein HDU76_007525 [Blyttiomyces sp. JEL0837]